MARPIRGRAALAAFASSSPPGTFHTGNGGPQKRGISTRATTTRYHHQCLTATATTLTNSATITKQSNHHRGGWKPSNRRKNFFSSLLMAAVDEDEADESTKTIDSAWDVKGLKQEVSRLTMRSHKKVGKASTRVRKATDMVEKLTADENATMEQLEACPNVDALEFELKELQTRLQTLNQLTELLLKEPSKGQAVVLPQEIAQLALDLGVDDQPPQRQQRGPTKQKGPRQKNPPKTRLPYRRFYTADKTEIRVGKQAEDNDELSMRPEHRAGSDWWMHASGCPGSHIVIRRSDEHLDDEIVQDAAALAARQSKCTGKVIKVSMTRCRHIQKPRGAKAGLVQLTGPVRSVTVNMNEAEKRLHRLDSTVVIN